MNAILSTSSLLMLSAIASAQIYSNQNTAQNIQAVVNNNLHGAGVSTFDFDHDGWDDITFALDDVIKIYRNNEGSSELTDFGFSATDNAKHPQWVDYDNDGDSDFFITQYLHPCKLYRNDNMVFTDVTSGCGIAQLNVPHFGSSWGDYDRDGDLDVYLCVYIFLFGGQNAYDYWDKLYSNNGDGTFTDVTLASGAHDGISLSFQSLWTDYNNDQWPDLYVINDELHPNRLYHNNGDGTFTDVGEQSGSALADVDAMTASGADFNNDGWEDIFVSNTSLGPCALLRNNGDGTFTDIAATAGATLDVLAWSGCWFDFDLDRDMDIYVCEYFPLDASQPNHFLLNMGNEQMADVNAQVFPFDYTDSYTVAAMDWNNDGYPDLSVNNYYPHNANLWQCSGGNNHHLKISLEGVVSNRDGVGSTILVWSDGVVQSRITHCGENYLGQDSQREIFGLKNFTLADSIFIHWPSGHLDQYINVQADQHLHFVEGEGMINFISTTGNLTLCPGDSMLLDAGNFASYHWSTGDTTQFITINEEGEYFVEVESALGFVSVSAPISIITASLPQFDIMPHSPSCFGGDDGWIEITSVQWLEILWNDATTDALLDSIPAGEFFYEVWNDMGCNATGAISLPQPDSLWYDVVTYDITCFGANDGSADIAIHGGTLPYSLTWTDDDITDLSTGKFLFEMTDSNGCSINIPFQITTPDQLVINTTGVDCLWMEAQATGGTPPYSFMWFDGSMEMISNQNLITDLDNGFYNCIATDGNNCTAEAGFIYCGNNIAEIFSGSISFYPNPCSGFIFIDGGEFPLATAHLLSVDGKYPTAVDVINNKMQVEDIAPGIYMVVIRQGKKQWMGRVVKM